MSVDVAEKKSGREGERGMGPRLCDCYFLMLGNCYFTTRGVLQ